MGFIAQGGLPHPFFQGGYHAYSSDDPVMTSLIVPANINATTNDKIKKNHTGSHSRETQIPIATKVIASSGIHEENLLLVMIEMGKIRIIMKMDEQISCAEKTSIFRLSATRYGISVKFKSV